MPKFYVILAGKSNKISKIFMIFAGKMTEFYMIIAEKIFFSNFCTHAPMAKNVFFEFWGYFSPLPPATPIASSPVNTWMGDCLLIGKPSRCVTNHLGQLSLPFLSSR